MAWHRRALALIGFCVCVAAAGAEQSQALVRADGAQVPVRVYAVAANSCRGIAVISPGAGGTAFKHKSVPTMV